MIGIVLAVMLTAAPAPVVTPMPVPIPSMSPSPASVAQRYVALGDSITYGEGASDACQPWPGFVRFPGPCVGTSFVARVGDALAARANAPVEVSDLGIGGARIGDVVARELPRVPADATLVTLDVGTNDARAIAENIFYDRDHDFFAQVRAFARGYDRALDAIRARAPQARIVLIDFPNQRFLNDTSVPPVTDPRPQLAKLYDAASRALARVVLAHRDGTLVVDVACDPRSYDRPYRASTVHPNDAGYALIATAVVDALASQRTVAIRNCPPYLR